MSFSVEIIGYGARIEGRYNPTSINTFIIQALFLLISPACFAATIYMILGRIIRFVDCEHATPIRSTRITKIFVTGDVLSFIAQGGGGGMMGQSNDSVRKIGQKIVLIGLFIQIIFFGAFVIVSIIVHRRIDREPSQRSLASPWRTHMKVLYSVSVLIFVRCIFRVVEYIQGFNGWLISHEWTLFVFDGSLMVLVLVLLYWKHPSSLLRQKEDNSCESTVDLQDRFQNRDGGM